MKKTVAASLLLLGLQACSGSSPSTSDVEKALKANVAGCHNIAVENVKLVNGLKIDDQTHKVQVTYDLRVVPLADSRVKEIQKLKEARDDVAKQLGEVSTQLADLYNQLTQQTNHDYTNGNWPSSEWDAHYAKLKEERGGPELEAKKEALTAQGKTLYEQASATNSLTLQDAWGVAGCRKAVGISSDDEVIAGGAASFDTTFVMQKSDNGWLQAE